MTEKQQELWEACAGFHGHKCGGLAIGFQAAWYASQLLGLNFSEDEEVVCVAENDACGVDAIQVMLGCSIGKGNLLFRMRGKQAFNFFNRKTGKSVRLVLQDIQEIPKEERMTHILSTNPSDLFLVKPVSFELPETARIFQSYPCENCGEVVAENAVRMENGKKLCLDCYHSYDRFSVN